MPVPLTSTVPPVDASAKRVVLPEGKLSLPPEPDSLILPLPEMAVYVCPDVPLISSVPSTCVLNVAVLFTLTVIVLPDVITTLSLDDGVSLDGLTNSGTMAPSSV